MGQALDDIAATLRALQYFEWRKPGWWLLTARRAKKANLSVDSLRCGLLFLGHYGPCDSLLGSLLFAAAAVRRSICIGRDLIVDRTRGDRHGPQALGHGNTALYPRCAIAGVGQRPDLRWFRYGAKRQGGFAAGNDRAADDNHR